MPKVIGFVSLLVAFLVAACAPRIAPVWGSFGTGSNGERIYFSATTAAGRRIAYSSGPAFGGGMGMMSGQLSCVSCHGPDGRGGVHMMHMQVMNAPDIRWSALTGDEASEHDDGDEHTQAHAGYDLDTFRKAVVEGQHPNGDPLDRDMPRWSLGDDDLLDLADYLKSLP